MKPLPKWAQESFKHNAIKSKPIIWKNLMNPIKEEDLHRSLLGKKTSPGLTGITKKMIYQLTFYNENEDDRKNSEKIKTLLLNALNKWVEFRFLECVFFYSMLFLYFICCFFPES